ncbi:MAG: glycerate kinase, partial [Pirellulaceae bacterium]
MRRSSDQLREDALAIWKAGVAAVDSQRLVRENVRIDGPNLSIGDEVLDLGPIRRFVVVGAGKAGAGMAKGIEVALTETVMAEKELSGWINVPEDCVRELRRIHLHAARPAGVNEPTEAGVEGARRILDLVGSMSENDVCLCLLSGGGSALLPAPAEGITLADKQAITQHLSASGANIEELNTVRKQLSRLKGGGLARACRAGRLVTLLISDVLGDPLDVIASGPTVADTATARDALDVLDRFAAREAGIPERVFQYLERRDREPTCSGALPSVPVVNVVVGNNAVAVDAAGIEAERRGYTHAMTSARTHEGGAEDVGRHLADMAARMRSEPGPDCLITGGEPIVRLAPAAERGTGGRNQQLVLAALQRRLEQHESGDPGVNVLSDIALLSGGTDGEDGPTDAAGAIIGERLVDEMRRHDLSPDRFLRCNDAYHFFAPLDGLIKTGPTHTNVCDVRVVTVRRSN